MSALQTYKNIQIPFPTEGMIRTAQIDDTVAPADSVQLAVNMNFDRVGAIQTRPGVTQYATDIAGPVKNFGTLNNAEVLDGYVNIKKLLATNDFSDSARDVSIAKVDDTHFIVFWSGASGDGFAQVVSVDASTGITELLGTALEFDTVDGLENKCLRISSTRFINFWSGSGSDGFVQVFAVDTTSANYTVTALGTALEFDTSDNSSNAPAQIDANHFINFYTGVSGGGFVSNFEVNLATFAVTEVGSTLTFDATLASDMSVSPLGDGLRFLLFWRHNGAEGRAQVFLVNTGTWAITAIGSPLSFDTVNFTNHSISLGDGQNFVNAWRSASDKGLVRSFNVNPATYAVTGILTSVEFEGTFVRSIDIVSMEDNRHFTLFWRGNNLDGFVQVFQATPLTFLVSETSEKLFFADAANPNSAILMNGFNILNFWGTTGSTPGAMVNGVFLVFGDIQYNKYLYAQNGDSDILNWDGTIWATQRSGLDTTQKARFAQYLNYIWMVNGGDTFGDAVMTSNGGAFGTTLVPVGFPKGDFISAGVEGRVWVADAGADVVYYTDIVQFVPPDNYTLTYDPEVNFISSLSSQDGQNITGLMRVPRALLLFKQDSIYRIYGATSIDSYPAYNVGTYSQESIVTTKTGIFFHHSSGFYQFDYGGQPIEISRRVIDFIKAIPRAYYGSVTGVFDGFDAIEWSVGPITVEDVTFTSCVMRYTISTQVWSVYDYVGHSITAMIQFDDGETLTHLMGTQAGKIGSMDTGETDFGTGFYFEFIDRWRAFAEMYYQSKSIDGMSVYSENGGGSNLMYQVQKSGPNVWETLGTITDKNNSILPSASVSDFDVLRFRIAGNTSGVPIVYHGIEILDLTIKGQDEN